MNTHILIPIKVFEEGLEHAKENIKEFGQEWFRAADTYSYLKLMGKQISFDETKIDLSYIEYCKKNPTLHIIYKDFTEGYKQALKYLL